MDMNREIARLLQYGVQRGLLQEEDRVYAAHRLLALLHLTEYEPVSAPEETLENPAAILEPMLDWACENGLVENNSPVYRDLFDTEIMTCLMPRPSEVVGKFRSLYQQAPEKATDYYYDLSRSSNYIRVDRVSRDEKWTGETPYGEIIITINLSKPEKDPKAIAAARLQKSSSYPKCALCRENEGFAGSVSQAARGNHRLIPVTLLGEDWFLQYSPYVYYNEHCILLNSKHTPMKVSRESMAHLLDFVRQFPHYFVGSNADLPIVGGSILSHDHFQGGRFTFPMETAPVVHPLSFAGYEEIDAGIVRWPLSVIRLSGENADRLCDLAEKILIVWRGYSDPAADILAFTDETPHNTITPIARMRNGRYELDLVLRNNRTTSEHPLGLFHPHAQYHHIKKENIGLIEVMGLAVLPARLKTELAEVEEALVCPDRAATIFGKENMKPHYDWFCELKARRPEGFTQEQAHQLVRQDVAEIFAKILEDAGVYKNTPAGKEAFLRFAAAVNAGE